MICDLIEEKVSTAAGIHSANKENSCAGLGVHTGNGHQEGNNEEDEGGQMKRKMNETQLHEPMSD